MIASAAMCGAATAESRQKPIGGKAGDKGSGGGPWIWRGRHGWQRNMTRRNTKPWLATDQETHDQPEPVSRHKNVV